MKLALALTVAAAGCTAHAAPAMDSPSSASGVKRLAEAGASHTHLSVKVRSRRGPLSTASRSLSRPAIAHNWTAVAECESNGDWHINTGNGYFGGLQESQRFWDSFGGRDFASRPDLATELEQIAVAERGLAAQGVGAWPVCGAGL